MTDTSKREELIERIKAVRDDGYLSATYLGNEHVGDLMGDILAVFEQAYTPTDDEREAHEFAQAQWPDLGVGGDADHFNKIARARFLEGVEWQARRPVQGESIDDEREALLDAAAALRQASTDREDGSAER